MKRKYKVECDSSRNSLSKLDSKPLPNGIVNYSLNTSHKCPVNLTDNIVSLSAGIENDKH